MKESLNLNFDKANHTIDQLTDKMICKETEELVGGVPHKRRKRRRILVSNP
jgi:hypothetical protein